MRWKNVLACAASCAFLLAGAVRAQDLSAKDLFLKGADNAKNSKGYHVSMEFEVTMGEGGMTMPFSGTSTLVNPDFTHSEMEFGGMIIETYSKGETAVMKNPMTDEWTSPDEMGGMMPSGALVSPMEQLRKMEKYLDSAKFEADDKVNGDECKVVSFSPPGEALKEVLGDRLSMMQIDLSKAKVMYKIWIDKASTMIRKVALDAQMSMPGGMPGMPGADGESPDGRDDEGDDLSDEGDGKPKDNKKDGDKPKEGDKGDEGGEDEGSSEQEISLTGSFNLTDYDKNLDIEIPDAVREKLGMPTLGGGEKKDGDKKDGDKKDGGDK